MPVWYYIAYGIAAYQAGKDSLAVEAFRKAPKMTASLLIHASAEWRLRNVETAQALIAEHLAMAPDKTFMDHFGTEALTRPDLAELREMSVQLRLPLSSPASE